MSSRKNKKSIGCKPTEQQKSHLIEYLENHTYLVEGDMMGRQKSEPWNEVAEELNALGGSQKSGAKWLKFWYDQRTYIRDRHAELNNKARRKMVSDPYAKRRKFNDYENRVMALLTLSSAKKENARAGNIAQNLDEFILPNETIEEETSESRTDLTENLTSESLVKTIESEWDSDDSRYSQQLEYTRKRIKDVLPHSPEMLSEVNIKSECNSEISSSSVPFPELAHTSTFSKPNDQADVPPPILVIEENIKFENDRTEPSNTSPVPSVQHTNRITTRDTEFSKPVGLRKLSGYCSSCKNISNKFEKDIQLKTLDAIEATEKFTREMEMKKLQVEERKVEALYKLINVVQNGFDRLANL